ncbi:hypothetical protein CR513_52314, partial [Mucuna pruriens]
MPITAPCTTVSGGRETREIGDNGRGKEWTQLTDLTELQVDSLFYPCCDLRCKLLQVTSRATNLQIGQSSSPWKAKTKICNSRYFDNIINVLERFDLGKLHAYDPKIDRIFHRLIRSPRTSEVANSSHNSSVIASDFGVLKSDIGDFDFDYGTTNSDSDFGVGLKELATPDIMCQPWCIRFPKLDQAQSYETRFGLTHLVPKFHGLPDEDPYKHLKEFYVVYSTMRPHGIDSKADANPHQSRSIPASKDQLHFSRLKHMHKMLSRRKGINALANDTIFLSSLLGKKYNFGLRQIQTVDLKFTKLHHEMHVLAN